MAMYEALHPTSLIRRIVIEDRAIPAKLAEDRIELAVVLLSGGKQSETKEQHIGFTEEEMAPCKNLKTARAKNESSAPVPS